MAEENHSPQQNQTPRDRRRSNQISSVQIMFAAILAIGLMLAVNFSNRIAADRSLKDIQDTVNQEIDLLKREQVELIEELNYVRSDAYVEAWARDEGKMVREGEVLIIPKPVGLAIPADPTPVPLVEDAVEITRPPDPEPWQLWWALFFDGEPPQF